jgi:hypothetical protein
MNIIDYPTLHVYRHKVMNGERMRLSPQQMEHVHGHLWYRHYMSGWQMKNVWCDDFNLTTRNSWKWDYNFPIVNFPFLCSNIPATHTYSIYLAQLIRYYRACALYKDSSFPLITAKNIFTKLWIIHWKRHHL